MDPRFRGCRLLKERWRIPFQALNVLCVGGGEDCLVLFFFFFLGGGVVLKFLNVAVCKDKGNNPLTMLLF